MKKKKNKSDNSKRENTLKDFEEYLNTVKDGAKLKVDLTAGFFRDLIALAEERGSRTSTKHMKFLADLAKIRAKEIPRAYSAARVRLAGEIIEMLRTRTIADTIKALKSITEPRKKGSAK